MDISNYLRPEHRLAGISLEDYEDYMELRAPGKKPMRFGIYTSIETIEREADQALEWARSGITFQEDNGEI